MDPSAPLPTARKPMARAARVNLIEREVHERLSRSAVELLLAHASVLSEGECARVAGGAPPDHPGGRRSAFFGSTMLTIELAALRSLVREACDEAEAARLARLLADDPRVAKRVREVAAREASRLAGGPVKPASSEVRVRAQGTTLFIDVDVEGEIAAPSQRRR